MLVKDKFFENRGSLYTIYDSRDFDINFVQDKISKSYQGVIRGFHGDDVTWKLITCLYGRLKLITYDVDTDIKEEYILDGDIIEASLDSLVYTPHKTRLSAVGGKRRIDYILHNIHLSTFQT